MNGRTVIARVPMVLAAVISIFAAVAAAQEKKELTYAVGPKAVISITNNYGPITVRPSGNRRVVVTTVSHSDAVNFVNEQHGNLLAMFRGLSGSRGPLKRIRRHSNILVSVFLGWPCRTAPRRTNCRLMTCCHGPI